MAEFLTDARFQADFTVTDSSKTKVVYIKPGIIDCLHETQP
jgi:hypothetical protein